VLGQPSSLFSSFAAEEERGPCSLRLRGKKEKIPLRLKSKFSCEARNEKRRGSRKNLEKSALMHHCFCGFARREEKKKSPLFQKKKNQEFL